MFGTVLAVVKMSACRPLPRAATSRDARAKPVMRERTVPAAITAVFARMARLSEPGASASGSPGGCSLMGRSRGHSLAGRGRRRRRTRRSAIAPKSSPPPATMTIQMIWLTWLLRMGSSAAEPVGVPSEVAT